MIDPTHDPIVEEAHQAGQALFARFNNDLHAVCEHLRDRTEEQRRAGRTVTSPSTSQPATLNNPAAAKNKKAG